MFWAQRRRHYAIAVAFTTSANRADAEQDVPPIVHGHDYVRVHAQNGICQTRSLKRCSQTGLWYSMPTRPSRDLNSCSTVLESAP